MSKKAKKVVEQVVEASAPVVEPTPVPVVEAPAPKKMRKPSVCARIKEILIQNPKVSMEDIDAQLKQEGFTFSASTVPTIGNDFLASLRLLQAAGHCREMALD